jgi:hypothetical protein
MTKTSSGFGPKKVKEEELLTEEQRIQKQKEASLNKAFGSPNFIAPQAVAGSGQPTSTLETELTPPEKTTTNIVFNPDRTVSVDGKTMSQEEYKATKGMTAERQQKTDEYSKQLDMYNRANELIANSEAKRIADKIILNRKITDAENNPLIMPEAPSTSELSTSPDLLEVGKIGAGITSGAALGASIGGPVGAVGLGIAGGAAALFYTQADERKQAVLTGKKKFIESSKAWDKNNNALQAGLIGRTQFKINQENIYQRIISARSEVEQAGEGTFGKKLSKNTDELALIESWLSNYEMFKSESDMLAMNPDPSRIVTQVGLYDDSEVLND